jgi:hypothetical protein
MTFGPPVTGYHFRQVAGRQRTVLQRIADDIQNVGLGTRYPVPRTYLLEVQGRNTAPVPVVIVAAPDEME